MHTMIMAFIAKRVAKRRIKKKIEELTDKGKSRPILDSLFKNRKNRK